MVIEVLRVFCDDVGAHGNPLGVVRDSAALGNDEAQRMAALLGYSETIFLDDEDAGALRIHTPTTRLAFAGHPTVGAAWYLHLIGSPTDTLHLDAGAVAVEASLAGGCVSAVPGLGPDWALLQLGSAEQVEAALPGAGPQLVYLWAWLDENAGLVRARCFASALGVDEDEATGSAAIALAAELHRAVTIRQGRGSVLEAAPTDGGRVRLAGRVVHDPDLSDDARTRLG